MNFLSNALRLGERSTSASREAKLACVAVLLGVTLISQSCKPHPPEQSGARPNIILIVTDDQDAPSLQHMPHTMDLLARRGIRFSNAFVASPVCVPSRVSILRGQYLHSHEVMEPIDFSNRNLDAATMATLMKAAGYRTALVGKYLGSGASEKKPPGWDVWQTMLTHNVYYNFEFDDNGKKLRFGADPKDYISTVLSTMALRFIEESSGKGPFFLYVGMVAPHAPATPPPDHKQEFADVTRLPQEESNVSDKPAWVRDFRALNLGRREERSPTEIAARRSEWNRNRLRSLLSVDEMIARMDAALSATGVADSTYIFFVSDNGDWVSKHVPTSAKLSPYDDGINVPYFVVGPGIDSGRERTQMVSTIDLLPTFAELAGAPTPPFVDGRSLVPLFRDETTQRTKWRDSVIAELGVIRQWPWASFPPPYRLLRSESFKYIEYVTGEKEYYDLGQDPYEMTNIFETLDETRRHALSEQINKAAPWPTAGFPTRARVQ